MNEADIIKALECCITKKCNKCPFRAINCNAKVAMAHAIELIKRQKAEIENWQAEYKRVCAERDAHICTNNFVRNEAIKEFAERLCEGRVSNDPVVISTKCLVKEMTEGKK